MPSRRSVVGACARLCTYFDANWVLSFKTIANMTVGKDVSGLFPDVLKVRVVVYLASHAPA